MTRLDTLPRKTRNDLDKAVIEQEGSRLVERCFECETAGATKEIGAFNRERVTTFTH